MAAILLVLALAVANVAAQCTPGISGALNPSYCACPSFFEESEGPACVAVNPASTCPVENVDNLVSEPVAELLESQSFFATELNLVIASPLKNNRLVTSIAIGSGSSPNCAYPGDFWFKSHNEGSCTDNFISSLDWATLGQDCGLTLASSGDDTDFFEAQVFIEVVDALSPLRGTALDRTTRSFLNLEIAVPTILTINNTIEVFGDFEVLSAITLVDLDTLDGWGYFEITTSVQSPYQLFLPSVVSGPRSVSVLDVSSGSCTPGSDCVQVFEGQIPLSFSGSDCGFSGTYQLQFTADCQSNVTCPGSFPQTVDVNATFVMNDNCAPVVVNAEVSGTLESFQDSGLTTPSAVFTSGSDIFFLASVQSGVEIIAVSLFDVTIDGNIISSSPVVASIGANELAFSIAPTIGPIGSGSDIETDQGTAVVTVEAALSITYRTVFTKRDSVTKTYTFARNVAVVGGTTESLEDGADLVSPTLALMSLGVAAHAL